MHTLDHGLLVAMCSWLIVLLSLIGTAKLCSFGIFNHRLHIEIGKQRMSACLDWFVYACATFTSFKERVKSLATFSSPNLSTLTTCMYNGYSAVVWTVPSGWVHLMTPSHLLLTFDQLGILYNYKNALLWLYMCTSLCIVVLCVYCMYVCMCALCTYTCNLL